MTPSTVTEPPTSSTRSHVGGYLLHECGVSAATAARCLIPSEKRRAAADRLLAHEADLVTMGGSRAQLQELEDTLITALQRSGRTKNAAERLDVQFARRATERDERWRATIAA